MLVAVIRNCTLKALRYLNTARLLCSEAVQQHTTLQITSGIINIRLFATDQIV
jgi:hypothetical protein